MRLIALPVLAACSLAAAPASYAADPPRQAYDHGVSCASHVMALQSALTLDGAKGAAEAAKLDPHVKAMRDKAVAAGGALSIPPERVLHEIDEGRDRLVAELHQPDAAKVKQAREEIGRTALLCAFDALEAAIADRKAKAAAAPGK